MILWLSGKLTDALQGSGAISGDDRDVYVYGLDVLLSTALNILCVLAAGLLLGRIPETLVYMLCFIVLRSAAGGYHANTHFVCLLILLAAYGASMALLMLLPLSGLFAVIFSAASLAAVLILAPAPHENRPVSGRELKKFRRLSIYIALVEAGAASTLALPAPALALCVSLGMLTSAVSLGAAHISGVSGRRVKMDPDRS
jgi:accessory gene regulator B